MNTKKTKSDNVIYLQRVSSFLDKSLFFIVFLFGVAGIFFLKWFGMKQLYVTAWPCFVMILYLFYIVATKRFQLREDIAGDNLYYLGFLFTLTSLAMALYQFAQKEGGTEAIITNFGIALATTILGLVFRVVFYQMRQDPVEIERNARLELSEAASNLKQVLNNVVIDMNSFRRTTQQSILEGLKEIADQKLEGLNKASENFENMARNFVSKLDAAFDSFTQNAKQMDDATFKTVTSIGNLIERLESIKVPENIIEDKISPIISGMDEVVEEMKVLAKENQKEIGKLSRRIGKAIDATDLLDGRIEALNKQMDPLHFVVTQITEMGDSFKNINLEIETVLDAIKETIGQQKPVLTGMWKSTQQVSQETTDSMLRMIRQQENSIEELLTKGKESAEAILQQAQTSANNQTKVFDSLVSTMEMKLEAVRRYNQGIENEFERASKITINIQEALASMSALLVKKLESTDGDKDLGDPLQRSTS